MIEGSKENILQTAFNFEDFQGLGRRKIWRLISLFWAEFFATAITLFLGCATVQGVLFNHKQDHLVTALAFGFAVGTSVMLFGHVSGSHINPALSLAAVIMGEMSLAMCVFYAIAQCSGATFGYTLTRAILPPNANEESNTTSITNPEKYFSARCCNIPDASLSVSQAVLTEVIATGILVWAVCSAWDSRNKNKHDSLPVKFAIVIIAIALPIALYSSCSINPARSFGPAFYNGFWDRHWIYWVGPLVGSIITATTYRFVFDPANMEIISPILRKDQAAISLRKNSHKCDEDA